MKPVFILDKFEKHLLEKPLIVSQNGDQLLSKYDILHLTA